MRGCKKPLVAPHLLRLPFSIHEAAASEGLPDEVDFRKLGLCPPVKNQGQTGSCEGHSSSSATQIRCKAAGNPLSFTPSELDIYRCAREIERGRNTPSGHKFVALRDEGALTEDVIAAMSMFGIRPRYVAHTSDGRDSDCEPDTINKEQTIADLELDSEVCLVFPPKHAINPRASDMVTQCRAALAAWIPLRVDAFVDSAFERWTPGAPPVGTPNTSDPDGGGHAVVIVGYDKQADGTFKFLLLNSWGPRAGEGGYWWVSEAWMRSAWGITPWDVTVK